MANAVASLRHIFQFCAIPSSFVTEFAQPKFSPMQPRPRAETSRLLFPSLHVLTV